jgi:hypothetical protein
MAVGSPRRKHRQLRVFFTDAKVLSSLSVSEYPCGRELEVPLVRSRMKSPYLKAE